MVQSKKVKNFVVLEEGLVCTGKILDCETVNRVRRKDGADFQLLDYQIQVDSPDTVVKASFSPNLSFDENNKPASEFAKLAVRFGLVYSEGCSFDEQSIVGKRVQFVTGAPNEVNKNGETKRYTTVIVATLMPEKKAQGSL